MISNQEENRIYREIDTKQQTHVSLPTLKQTGKQTMHIYLYICNIYVILYDSI